MMSTSGEVMTWQLSTEPRAWQSAALGAWQRGARRGVASVVTGGGKTMFAFLCMREAASSLSAHHVVIVVPTLALLDQWYVALVDDLGVPSSDIGLYSGEGIASQPGRVNLMVLNTARHWAPELSGQRPTLLIVDECHRAASPENAKALAGRHVATLGLSATPERDYDNLFAEVIVPALGPVICEYGYNEARRDSVIAPFKLVNVEAFFTPAEQEQFDQLTRRLASLVRRHRQGEDVEERLQRLFRERASVSAGAASRIPIGVRLVETEPGQRVLVFHEQIRAADELVRLVDSRMRRVAAYHSGLSPGLRRDNLRMFRRGQLDVLVTCRAIDEGINVPEANVAIIVSSTSSTRQRIQRLGRVLRPALGKELATIYTLFVTQQERTRLEQEAEHLEGVEAIQWLSAAVPGRA